MPLRRVVLKNFRNYRQLSLELDPSATLVLGKNAQGKTNFLEGVYYGATGRSFRVSSEQPLLTWETDNLAVNLEINNENGHFFIQHSYSQGKKLIKVNHSPVRRSEAVGLLPVVVFTPEELDLVKRSPESRRRYLDEIVSQYLPFYRSSYARYLHILNQRNHYLRRGQGSTLSELKIWTEQLVEWGTQIISCRGQLAIDLGPLVNNWYRRLTGEKADELQISYSSSIGMIIFSNKEIDNVKTKFLQELEQLAGRERHQGITLVGPQRDDLSVSLNGKSLKLYGSQGQQRTAVLALKLAARELLKKKLQQDPLLLLDDVLSELDEDHKKALLEQVFAEGQSILTSTAENPSLEKKGPFTVLNVHKGQMAHISRGQGQK